MAPPDPTAEGTLRVQVAVESGRVAGVGILSTRPVLASRVLEGKPVAEAMAALPRLFRLCGTAQAVAGLSAVGAVLGLEPGADTHWVRRLLVTTEALEQTLWLLLVHLPVAVGGPPELAELAALRRALGALRCTLSTHGDWSRPGGRERRLNCSAGRTARWSAAERVARAVFGTAEDANLATGAQPALLSWAAAGSTPTARLCRQLLDDGRAGFGRSEVPVLPAHDPIWFGDRLAADTDGGFRSRPTHLAIAAETGSWPRRRFHPLCAELARDFGNGLVSRLAAHLVNVAGHLAELQTPGEEPAVSAAADGMGAGTAVVDTARGLLAHRVEIDAGTIRSYRILAPTEWNFHPGGPVASGLLGVRVADLDAFRQTATLLAVLVDPCVVCYLDLI